MAIKSLEEILPRAHSHLAAFDGYAYPWGQRLKMVLGGPLRVALDLIPFRIQPLLKISLPVQKRDPYHWNTKISGRTEHIAGQNAQSATVCRNMRIDGHI